MAWSGRNWGLMINIWNKSIRSYSRGSHWYLKSSWSSQNTGADHLRSRQRCACHAKESQKYKAKQEIHHMDLKHVNNENKENQEFYSWPAVLEHWSLLNKDESPTMTLNVSVYIIDVKWNEMTWTLQSPLHNITMRSYRILHSRDESHTKPTPAVKQHRSVHLRLF